MTARLKYTYLDRDISQEMSTQGLHSINGCKRVAVAEGHQTLHGKNFPTKQVAKKDCLMDHAVLCMVLADDEKAALAFDSGLHPASFNLPPKLTRLSQPQIRDEVACLLQQLTNCCVPSF